MYINDKKKNANHQTPLVTDIWIKITNAANWYHRNLDVNITTKNNIKAYKKSDSYILGYKKIQI